MSISRQLIEYGKRFPGFSRLRTLRRFSQLPPGSQSMAIEALFLLLGARLALLVLPFRTIANALGTTVPADRETTAPSLLPAQGATAAAVGFAVSEVGKRLSLNCLPQAIAARIMLRRRLIPSVLHFGVCTGDTPARKLEAHAWIEVASTTITGAFEPGYFKEIARLV